MSLGRSACLYKVIGYGLRRVLYYRLMTITMVLSRRFLPLTIQVFDITAVTFFYILISSFKICVQNEDLSWLIKNYENYLINISYLSYT
jgi:hypothetical protein